MILVTGSEGLIGRRFCRLLDATRLEYARYDLKLGQDICDREMLKNAVLRADGVVHLAALTRVKRCEAMPYECKETNLYAVAELADFCDDHGKWLVFASSREVYGEQEQFPVAEDARLHPKNIYARSKAAGEALMTGRRGQFANIIRFSNVYGDVDDHPDRVVPAFARAAAEGERIVVQGMDTTLDLVHVDDAASGLLAVTALTMGDHKLPPIHLVSGIGTPLGKLADLALAHGASGAKEVDPNPIHVERFVGSKQRAFQLLGWEAKTPIEKGFARLVEDFRKVRNEPTRERL